jgi:hypothetical protein
MSWALCWKEWREHRRIWLAMAALAVFLAGGMMFAIGPGGDLYLSRSQRVHDALFDLLVVLAVSYGLVCGAMMLASEREAGTQPLLDMLADGRNRIWRTKVFVGLGLTLSLTLTLLILCYALGRPSDVAKIWDQAVAMLVYSCGAFAWGLVGSSLCRTALSAAGLGGVFLGLSWTLAAGVGWMVGTTGGAQSAQTMLSIQCALAVAGAAASWKRYCRTDLQRRRARPSQSADRAPSPLVVLLWLAVRQGRTLLVVLAATCPLFGALIPVGGALLWPVGTLVTGVLCGHAVFSGEQASENYRFLGNQRLPMGRIWAVKMLFWAIVAVGGSVMMFLAALVHLHIADSQTGLSRYDEMNLVQWLQDNKALSVTIPPVYFLPLWIAYGFCAGLLVTQLVGKPVIAVALALVAGVLLAALWVPSLVLGGVLFWQVFSVPIILILASRLLLRPWAGDRLSTSRPFLGILSVGVIAVALTAAGLWYRPAEVPDIGEPFDVQAFLASFPTPEKNEAGQLLRTAAADLDRLQEREHHRLAQLNRETAQPAADREPDYYQQMQDVLEKGWWAAGPGLGLWLDEMFQGTWASDCRKAANLPLGMVYDPRDRGIVSPVSHIHELRFAAVLLTVQALRIQAQGETSKALDYLVDVLGLSRQLRHLSTEFYLGVGVEGVALDGLHQWVMKLGPREALLQRASKALSQHKAQTPPASDTVKVDYLVFRNDLPIYLDRHGRIIAPDWNKGSWEVAWAHWLRQVPWERERQSRLFNAVFTCLLHKVEQPVTAEFTQQRAKATAGRAGSYAALAFELGFDMADGRIADLSLAHWGKLLQRAGWASVLPSPWIYLQGVRGSRRQVEAARLQLALVQFQIHNRKPAATLDDLVPEYIEAIPLDPFTGKPFRYRVSKGEKLTVGNDSVEAQPGQGILLSDSEYPRVFLVPYLTKK